MTRAAGDSDFYSFGLIGHDGQLRHERIQLPSVTTILDAVGSKPWLAPWGFKLGLKAAQELAQVLPDGLEAPYETIYAAAKERELTPNQIRDKAGDKGTGLHEFFESMTNIKPPSDLENVPFLIESDTTADQRALWDWWRTQQVEKVIAREEPVWDLRHGYAGTLDLLFRGEAHGDFFNVIADLKSGSTFDNSMWYQVAAYRHAAETIHKVKADTGLILHIPAGSGKVTEHWRTGEELDSDFRIFLNCLAIYEARNGR